METLREQRIPMQLRVEVRGADWEGKPFDQNAFTVDVSRFGARLNAIPQVRSIGETLELRRGKDHARYRVVWLGEPGTPVEGQVGLRCLEPAKNIWGAPLPPPQSVSVGTASEAPPAQTEEPRSEPEAEPVPDTVSYGPQLATDAPPLTVPAPELTWRPVALVALAAGALLAVGFGWSRLRTSSPPQAAPVPVVAPASSTATQVPPPITTPAPAVATPKTQPAETPTAAAGTSAFYAVQVGAYENAATAQELADKLSSRYNKRAVVSTVEAQGKVLHRVQLLADGPDDAKALAARLRSEQNLRALVVKLE